MNAGDWVTVICIPDRDKEKVALIHSASAGLAPVRSDKLRLHLARKPSSIFPDIAGGHSGKNKNEREGLGATTCILVWDKSCTFSKHYWNATGETIFPVCADS